MEFEINGIKYKEREKQPSKPMSKSMATILMMSAMFGGFDLYGNSKHRKAPTVNLISEFELIQQKKSKLSRSNRNWVVFQFNRRYEQILNDNSDPQGN